MKIPETRGAAREHVLLLAGLTVENSSTEYRIRIRDLSQRGLRADGDVVLQPRQQVEIDFGAAGKVRGVVEWCDGTAFGISLEQDVEPDAVRRAAIQKDAADFEAPWYVRRLARKGDGGRPARKV